MSNYLQGPNIVSDYLFAKANAYKIPLTGTFELSPVCNMDCKMCYVRMTREEVNKGGGEKSADEWIKLAQECKDAGTLYLLLTGGEPFLYKDFRYLYEELKKMGFILSINTNATMLNDEIISWLSENPPSKMNITLYGSCNETYEKLCNNPKGYDQVTTAIKKLKKAGIMVVINVSLTPYNIDDIDEISAFAKANQITMRGASYMFPPIRREKSAFGMGNRFTAQEAGKASVRVNSLKCSKEQFIKNAKEQQEKLNEYVLEKNCEAIGSKMPCGAGKSGFWISWNGKMTACGMMDKPCVCYPFDTGFLSSWEKIVDEVENLEVLRGCFNCKNKEVCKVCPGMCYTETGDLNLAPKYICDMTNSIIKETKLKYQELSKEKERM